MAKKENEYVDLADEPYVDSVESAPIDGEIKEEKVSKQDAYLENLRKAKEVAKQTKDEFKRTDYKLLRNDAYQQMDTIVSMVRKGVAISGMVYSKGGLGKTFRMRQLLKDTDYEVIMTKLTPKALYCLLYEYRNSDIIWFDDVTRIMKDPLILGFLKSICGDGNSEASQTRTVQYNVSTPIKDAEGNILPDNFEITARILITTNEMPNGKNANLDLGAVLSRLKKAKVEISRVELLKIFEQVVQNSYGELSLDERQEVLDFIKANTNDRMDNLNLRTLFDGFDYRRIAKLDGQGEQWKINVLEGLDRDSTTVYLEGLLQDPNFYSEKDRIDAFNKYLVENGQKAISKATFHRKANKLIEEQGVEPAPYKRREAVSVEEETPQ